MESSQIGVKRPSAESDAGVSGDKEREDYISRDEYFMAVAFLSAQRSKDPETKVINNLFVLSIFTGNLHLFQTKLL